MVIFPVIFAEFPSERTGGVSSRSITVTNKSNSLTYTVASSFVCTSPLAVTTDDEQLDAPMVSNSAELRSYLLTMCMLAPVFTTNSLASGFITDGAGRHHSLAGEWNVLFSFSLSLKILLASFHASPRAHRSCLSVSS